MFAPKKILVPTDFSDDADEALKEALDVAKQYHSKVYVLHVTDPVIQCIGEYCLEDEDVRKIRDKDAKRSQEQMQEELSRLGMSEGVEVVTETREGEPVTEILREQDEKDIDLTVMPSHRKKGFFERVMGPVSERVMEQAKRPVLIVHH